MLRAYFVFLGSAVLLCNSCGLGYIYKKLNIANAINMVPLIECVINIAACLTLAAFCLSYALDKTERLSVGNTLLVLNIIIFTGGE